MFKRSIDQRFHRLLNCIGGIAHIAKFGKPRAAHHAVVYDAKSAPASAKKLSDATQKASASPASAVSRLKGIATRQTLLFSATLDNNIAQMAKSMLKEPVRIDVSGHQTKHENIEQRLHFADDLGHKNRLLDHLLRDAAMNQAIVFTSTKRAADDLATSLNGQGFAVAALHGDMKQGARNRTLQAMKRGGVRVLVATDVAARGLDVQGISHVINYDLPRQAEDYVHRIGRTGRAGRSGIAISLANVREQFQVKLIERFTTQRIPVTTIAGLEPKQTVALRPARPDGARPGGARKTTGYKPAGGKPSGNFNGGWKPASKTFGKGKSNAGSRREG